MMTTCQEIQQRASLFVDGLLPPDEHAVIAAHLQTCADCRGVARDLTRIRTAGAGLGPIAPPEHIWLEVAGQIRLEAGEPDVRRPAARSRTAWRQWAGLAASLVIATLGAYWFLRGTPDEPAVLGSNAPVTGSVEVVAEQLRLATQHYERAIAELEALTKGNEGALDPALVAVLQQNIQTIDRAIDESRGALAGNPESEPARESLFEALRRKMGVLQATVTLMNEMRQGDPAGAAAAAAAAGKKS